MKKEYINPTIELFELNPEGIIAGAESSLNQGGGKEPFDPEGGDIELSNKKDTPWNSPSVWE